MSAVIAFAGGVAGFSHQRALAVVARTPALTLQCALPTADAIKLCSLGYDQLLADWYWLGFVQYIGDGDARTKDHYVLAESYIDLITGLDPRFVQPYWFAAFIIGSEQHQPQRAAELIEKGLSANPNTWYLPFIAGINQYLYAHNEVAAAKYYRMAAKFPDAPKWLDRQANILEARIPSYIKEINIWDNIYRSSQDPLVKQRAREKLIVLWAHVYKSSTAQIRQKARDNLRELGIYLP
jgi:hypothetical protein